jgi:hypothetical protein
MSDTTEPRDNSTPDGAEPLNDSAELRDAIRSIEAIGEDRTGVDESGETDADTEPDTDDPAEDDAVANAGDAS